MVREYYVVDNYTFRQEYIVIAVVLGNYRALDWQLHSVVIVLERVTGFKLKTIFHGA